MSFRKLPAAAQVYIIGSVLISAWIVGSALVKEQLHPDFLMIVLVAASLVSSIPRLELVAKNSKLILSNAVAFLAIILGPGVATPLLLAMLTGFVSTVFIRRKVTWYKPCLSMANLVQANMVAWIVWRRLVGTPARLWVTPAFLGGLVAASAAYFLVNTVGISLAVALSQRSRLWSVWRENFIWAYSGYLCAASAAAVTAIFFRSMGLVSLLFLCPVYVAYCSYRLHLDRIRVKLRHIQELNDLNVRVIGTLAMTIEAKDRYTRRHVERVREYGLAIAGELGLTGPQLEAVRIGAMVHDIGKIAVPEAILTKPGKLTAEEYERMKSHVAVGVRILAMVGFPFPVTDAVAAHHERWDGNGYPNGLKGEEIPIVGRVVALADGFDALTSDRPYRNRLTDAEALQLIQDQGGQQYDPRVVQALIKTLPRVRPIIEELDRHGCDEDDELAGHRRMVAHEALEEIARTAEEAVVLSEMSLRPSMTTTPDEISDLLLQKAVMLVPATSAAVFMLEGNELTVQRCRGLYGPLLKDLTMKVGEGVSGWVVAEGEAAINAPAAGDLARRVKPGQHLELNSSISVPLRIGERCVGALTLYHTGYNLYSPHHQRLLTTLAMHAAGALDTVLQVRTNRALAYTDSLTGLANMRHLIQHLNALTDAEAATQPPFSVVLLDLNHFKQINDRHGHLEGDRVLQDVAGILRECTRGNDLIGRYAGDEFIVICHECDLEGTERIANRIRRGFAEHRSAHLMDGSLSAAIGASAYPADGRDWRTLLSTADLRMYSDKLTYKEARAELVDRGHPAHSTALALYAERTWIERDAACYLPAPGIRRLPEVVHAALPEGDVPSC